MTKRLRLGEFSPFAARVGAQLVLFVVLERLVRGLGRLPASAYGSRFFLRYLPGRLARPVEGHTVLLLGVALLVGMGLAARWGRDGVRRLGDGWSALEDGRALGLLVGALTGVAAWTWSTYAYNAWFDHTHGLDRLLLVALWGLLLWRPIFLLPFAAALAAVLSQFDLPLSQFSWTEADLLLRIPILAAAFWTVRAFGKERGGDSFVFLLCCLVAVTYWWSGVGKIRVDWLSHPHIDLLIFGAYANGWLAFLEPDTIVRIARGMAPFTPALMLFTLTVECGAVLVLAHRRSLQALLGLWLVFHTGVFLFSGIFFWKWMLVEAALLVFLRKGRRVERLPLFAPAQVVLSVLLIVGCTRWVAPGNLTWYDTPLTYSTRIEVQDRDGNSFVLPAGFFAPYAEMFTLNLFPYLSPDPQLTGTMGAATVPELADALVTARTPETVFAMERRATSDRYDATRSARFDALVSRFVELAARPGAPPLDWLRWVRPPRHFWNFAQGERWSGEGPIQRVRVTETTLFYDGQQHREIRRRELRSFSVPSAP